MKSKGLDNDKAFVRVLNIFEYLFTVRQAFLAGALIINDSKDHTVMATMNGLILFKGARTGDNLTDAWTMTFNKDLYPQ